MLLVLKYWKSAGSMEKRQAHFGWRFFPKDKNTVVFRVLKTVADLSSILCVVIGWLWGQLYRAAGVDSVRMVGKVDSDGFQLLMPGSGVMDDVSLGSVFTSAAVMAIVGFLETIAVGGKFAMAAKYEYDPNQELLALGVANVAGSVFGAYPTTGSFSRTAVNAMLGATSTFACAQSACVVFVATYVLLPVIQYLPLAALAPIIIQGAIGVVSVKDFKAAFGSSRTEFVVMLLTFCVSLILTVKEGLAVGFILSVLKTLRDLANPNFAVLGQLEDGSFRDVRNFPDARLVANTVAVRMDARLGFFNARKFKEFCLTTLNVRRNYGDEIEYLMIDARPINHVDLTGGEMLESLAESLQGHGQKLVVANLKSPVLACLAGAGVTNHLEKHGGFICADMSHAMAIITKQDVRGSVAHKDVVDLVERAAESEKEKQLATGSACILQ
jgi:SulP family sulfate permease